MLVLPTLGSIAVARSCSLCIHLYRYLIALVCAHRFTLRWQSIIEENALVTSIHYNNDTCSLKLAHQKTDHRDIRQAEIDVQRKYHVLRGAHRVSTHKSSDPIAQESFYPSRRSPSRWILFEEHLLQQLLTFLASRFMFHRSMKPSLRNVLPGSITSHVILSLPLIPRGCHSICLIEFNILSIHSVETNSISLLEHDSIFQNTFESLVRTCSQARSMKLFSQKFGTWTVAFFGCFLR